MNEEEDLEVAAMPKVYGLLKPLSPDERARVVAWVVGKLDIGTTIPAQNVGQPVHKQAFVQGDLLGAPSNSFAQDAAAPFFSSFAELCAAADPTTSADKALVAGYWLQVCGGLDTFTSMACNTELKHYGTAVGNITRAFDLLIGTRPQLVVQMEKSGKSAQARKKYKVTTSGIKAVEEMMRNNVHI